MVKLAIGSYNPVKIEATRKASSIFWKDPEVFGFDANSDITEMPMTKEETRDGAKNRANSALRWLRKNEQDGILLGVGMEGGVCSFRGDWYLFGATFVTDGNVESWGGETMVRLPIKMYEGLEGGKIELGTVTDNLTGEKETKKRGGAIAVLSDNKILRDDLFDFALQQALTPWIHGYEV